MTKLKMASVASAILLVATAAFAQGPRLAQVQPLAPTPMPAPGADPVPVVTSEPMSLYHCVRYKDERNIAPCAVPQIVLVKDPCWKCDPCNPCATAPCVAVQICVPPCSECPPRVCCKRGGEYVSYDYGKYKVEIVSRRGVVTVDYDD